MPKLERSGRQKQHAIEGAGKRPITQLEILIGIDALQLPGKRGAGILQMVGLVKNQQRRPPPSLRQHLFPKVPFHVPQRQSSIVNSL